MNYFVGIDNGGTMTKASIFDQAGREMATCSAQTPLIMPQEGYQQRDMLQLWDITAQTVKLAIIQSGVAAEDILAVGCTGHGKGLYLWGKDGKPAYDAIASTDRRAEAIVQRWYQDGTADRAQERVLQKVIACQPVALLAWMKAHHRNIYDNIQWIFEAKDYIRFMLTDQPFAEATDYSGTCLMNLRTCDFDQVVLDIYGIGEVMPALPPLCYSYESCGTVTRRAAQMTGLKEGTVVCGGMFDIDACAIAMDVSRPEQLCVITGTWSINEYPAQEPVDSSGGTKNSLFCVPGHYLIEESSPTSAGNLDWYLEHFFGGEKPSYQQINQMVSQLHPNDSHVIFCPFLYGTNIEGCDNAAFVGLSNFHQEQHLARAVFEGVVFSHLDHINRLLQFRKPPEVIRLAGGAANSDVWVQMFADALGIAVEVVEGKELGTLGCAMAGAVAAGVYVDYPSAAKAMVKIRSRIQPQEDYTSIYKKKYRRYQRATSLLSQLDECE